MANGNTITLNDRTMRKVRKAITRDARGSFEVCEDHERRMRADSFDLVIEADGAGHMSVQAVARLSCGHTKNPCKDSRRMILADESHGIAARVAKLFAKVDEADETDEADEADETPAAQAS